MLTQAPFVFVHVRATMALLRFSSHKRARTLKTLFHQRKAIRNKKVTQVPLKTPRSRDTVAAE